MASSCCGGTALLASWAVTCCTAGSGSGATPQCAVGSLELAIISGLVATTACNPADVIKSRVMMARGEGESISVTQAVVQVVRQQGFRGFMSGWCPAYCRAGPAYFIQMPVVEGLRHLFGVESL
mmetsp:Transcript_109345/g.341913  ORF Transcript_109345/g.341913 Transcript_109345/m.341913 type:complete len:124 (+) Transcript_109345:302-673(+)